RLALALRVLVVEEAPAATEIVYDGSYTVSIIFSFTAKWTDGFCHVVPCSDHVNLGFNRGAELPNPAGRLQGTGKQIRHIKVKTEDDLKKAILRDFVRLAISHALSRTPLEKQGEAAG